MTRNLTPDQINEIEAKAREHAQREWFEPGTASSGHATRLGLVALLHLRRRVLRLRHLEGRHEAPPSPKYYDYN